VLPTAGPTAGLIDDDKPCDEAAEAEMRDSDVTDDDSDEEEMEADDANAAQVGFDRSVAVTPVCSSGRL